MKTLFDESPCYTIRPNGNGTTSVSFATAPVDINFVGNSCDFLPFPHAYMAPLGAIILQWGAFENEHDTVLKNLCLANGTPLEEIPSGFERRRKLLKTEARAQFQAFPELAQKICDLLGTAKEIYPLRNILAHGQLGARITVSGKTAQDKLQHKHIRISISGEGVANGKPVTADFTMADLRSIYYSIGQLRGRLKDIIEPDRQQKQRSSAEIQALRDFQDKARGTDPSPNKPSHQPQA